MIFLAVTLGFFAEGLREHVGDKTKEKEYLSTMFEELKYDTAQYHISLNKINVLNPLLDSCYLNVKQADQFNCVLLAKWNTPVNEVGVIYKPALPTINQLKSSGNLRLIEERPIATKVMEYETFIDGTYQDHCVSVQAGSSKVFAIEDELCDYTDFNAKLGELCRNNSKMFYAGVFYGDLALRHCCKPNKAANLNHVRKHTMFCSS